MRASAGSVTWRGLTLTSVLPTCNTPSPRATRFWGQFRRRPCPERTYKCLPSVVIQMVTWCGFPDLRPKAVSLTSRSRFDASSRSAPKLSTPTTIGSHGLGLQPPPASRHFHRPTDGLVHGGATACRGHAVPLAFAQSKPRGPVTVAFSVSPSPARPARGSVVARGAGGGRRRYCRRQALRDRRLRRRRQQPADRVGVRRQQLGRGPSPSPRA